MCVFRGSNEINLDTKGRLAIPARYRDALMSQCGGSLVVTIDIKDKCLFIYPLPEWEKIENQIAALPTFNDSTRRMQRLLIGHARDVDLDASGRILVPPELRKHAEIDKKIMLVGQRHRFELWSLENWNASCGTWLEEAAGELSVPDAMQSLSL
ncbi:MAG: division/cell wall cluster transcriptional repressor MraZ [Porticoccaceae bacterium]|nr:division/cell wall cluster transcriptional repressor MraZ [Porticoccaceae bacterium]